MKIACISDLHGNLPEIPPNIDLLLIAGDICWEETTAKEEVWLRTKFEPWLIRHDINTIAVAGNHDFYLEKYKKFGEKCTFLENSYTRVRCTDFTSDVIVYGTPLSLEIGEWVYQASEDDIFRATANKRCDIILSHGPAYGVLDQVLPFGKSVGSTALRQYLEIEKPRLMVCGHIHESRGVHKYGQTVVINAAYVDRRYAPYRKIYVVDVSNRMGFRIDSIGEWDCIEKKYTNVMY